MSKKLVIFDLDGTLLNSVYAIANASNKSLQKYGLKTYNPDDYVNYIGNGLRKMVELILKEQGSLDKEEKVMDYLLDVYSKEYDFNLHTYKGIRELLFELEEKGIKYAIITNKDNDLAKKSCEIDELKDFSFYKIIGLDPNNIEEKKPSPINVERLISELNLEKKDVLFVGDMIVDLNTANNSGVDFAYCNWGFGSAKNEQGIDEKYKVDSVEELIERYL